jgi:solute carrier family 25 protein 38
LTILETRYELAGSERWSGSVLNGLKRLYASEGAKGYFKGCLTSCYKEGIFAGLFYSMYEEGKKLGISSSVSGIFSGVISTLITHPFEIVRTQLQTSSVYASPHGEWLRMSIK